jgi:phospholipase A1
MVSLLLRHNLDFDQGRGFLQLDWRPIKLSRSVGVHVQLTSGYGESLIDYNHRQNTVGVGLSIIDWK